MTSDKQIAANRENAKRSTGPRSAGGKRKSRRNAFRHGLTAETVIGVLTLGTLTFLAGAIAGASTNIQAVFTTFSSIADQALFLTDLLDFFSVKPKIIVKPDALPVPRDGGGAEWE